jgi:hypothetical protein
MPSVLATNLGDLTRALGEKQGIVSETRASPSNRAIVEMLDALLDYYAGSFLNGSSDGNKLHDLHVAASQVRAIREALVSDDRRPTIY